MAGAIPAVSLADRDRAVLWHPYTQMLTADPPLAIARGQGVWLYTEDGRRILDGISSWWVNLHGHSHPRLNRALARQARELEHVVFAGCTHRPAVELAERLLDLLPKGLARVFYSDNGSTAVEVALKMAVQYWQHRGQPERSTFVTLRHAYHGDTVGAMSASEDSHFTRPYAPLLFPVVPAGAPTAASSGRLPGQPDPAESRPRAGGRPHVPVAQVARTDDLEATLGALGASVAAVLLEPMLQGAGGMIVRPAQFLRDARRLCDRHGALLIADEVLTGFGRTGKMFACEHAGVTPDILCLAKALTAGYLPLGATVATEAVYSAFLSQDRARTFFHGHSYTANPLACAVALASLDVFRDEPVLERVAALERRLRQGLEPLRSYGDVRVIGGVGVIELASGSGYLDQAGPRIAAAAAERGLLLRPLGNVVYFMPPYAVTEAETDWALEQIASVLKTLAL
jgi:adenosylmethionine-8-amino-7-oxononanoate aminotransferase